MTYYKNKILSLFLILLLTFLTLKFVNWVLPTFLVQTKFDFILPINQKVILKTDEFDTVISTNKFGFRGPEKSFKTGQILTIGDSQTYGFGLDYLNTWPYLLEKKIKEKDINLEVYNLGAPGTDTDFHIEVTKKYIKLLKPKYIILTNVLWDDFAQLIEKMELKKDNNTIREYLKKHFFHLYNLGRMLNHSINKKQIEINPVWIEQSKKYLSYQNNYPKLLKEKIQKGYVNPGLLYIGKYDADRCGSFWINLDNSKKKEVDTYLSVINRLIEIEQISKKYNTEIIILSMPSGCEVKSNVTKNYISYGLKINQKQLNDNLSEKYLQNLAIKAGLQFIPTLDEARKNKEDLFFSFDGHLNPKGGEFISNIVANHLIKKNNSNGK